MFSLYNKFKIKVIYKSGATHEFWCHKFTSNVDCSSMSWKPSDITNKPLVIDSNVGDTEIAAIWQVDFKKGIFGEKQ